MAWNNTKTGYGSIPIALHWLMVLLIAAVYAAMELKSIFPKGSAQRDAMAAWHHQLGLCVFCLAWLRLLLRFAGAAPVIEPAPPAWQVVAARASHWALYALMVGLPLLGWLTLSAKGASVPFFGAEAPALIGKSDALAKWLRKIHEAGATLGYLLIAVHAAAALHHHSLLRDNTLKLMLPRR